MLTAMTNLSGKPPSFPLKTVIIGFGKIAASMADCNKATRFYPSFTHAQILEEHPDFDWVSVIDVDKTAQEMARARWGVEDVASAVEQLNNADDIEVAVLATPPTHRLEFVKSLPNLKAVVTEKPLGVSLADATTFLEYCDNRKILVQVNYPRRADERFSDLVAGGLEKQIGKPQAIFGIYGNGLRNNGTHMIDVCRLLFGEIMGVQALGQHEDHGDFPILGDKAIDFLLIPRSGVDITVRAVDFRHYRENGLDIWGTKGRLSILQEMTDFRHFSLAECRILDGEKEISSDQEGQQIYDESSRAYHNIYDNLAQSLATGCHLSSPGNNAKINEQIIEAISLSAKNDGQQIMLH